jgi:TRAP-type transport system periplasmic protein
MKKEAKMKRIVGATGLLVFLLILYLPLTVLAQSPSEISLRLATHTPKTHYIVQKGFEPWAEELEKQTKGRVKVTIHHSSSLGRINETYDMVRKGVADVGFLIPATHAGLFPVHDLFELPFLVPYGQRGRSVGDEVFKKYMEQTEFKDVKVLWVHRWEPITIMSRKKPVRTLEDIKGMTLGMPGGKTLPGFVKLLGGSPAAIPTPDIYSSLEKGIIDAYLNPIQTAVSYKLYEIAKTITMINTGSGLGVVVLNKDKWNAMPPDVQKVFSDLSPWARELQFNASNANSESALSACKQNGVEIITPTEDEMKRWKAAAGSQEDDWAKTLDAKGLPGSQIVKEIRGALASKP